jgi:hypothetical protein
MISLNYCGQSVPDNIESVLDKKESEFPYKSFLGNTLDKLGSQNLAQFSSLYLTPWGEIIVRIP